MQPRPQRRDMPKQVARPVLKQPVLKPFVDQEKLTAAAMQGKRQRGSGSGPTHKGDVKADRFLIENKITSHNSLAVKYEWLEKITREARAVGKVPMLGFGFAIQSAGYSIGAELDWAAIPFSKMSVINQLLLYVAAGEMEKAQECLVRL